MKGICAQWMMNGPKGDFVTDEIVELWRLFAMKALSDDIMMRLQNLSWRTWWIKRKSGSETNIDGTEQLTSMLGQHLSDLLVQIHTSKLSFIPALDLMIPTPASNSQYDRKRERARSLGDCGASDPLIDRLIVNISSSLLDDNGSLSPPSAHRFQQKCSYTNDSIDTVTYQQQSIIISTASMTETPTPPPSSPMFQKYPISQQNSTSLLSSRIERDRASKTSTQLLAERRRMMRFMKRHAKEIVTCGLQTFESVVDVAHEALEQEVNDCGFCYPRNSIVSTDSAVADVYHECSSDFEDMNGYDESELLEYQEHSIGTPTPDSQHYSSSSRSSSNDNGSTLIDQKWRIRDLRCKRVSIWKGTSIPAVHCFEEVGVSVW